MLPAVTHVDGTGRLQTVDKTKNKLFYELIMYFKSLSGVPVILNTSFNENEPIVNTPDEAINCFFKNKNGCISYWKLCHYKTELINFVKKKFLISIWADPSNYINLLFLINFLIKKNYEIILICKLIEKKKDFFLFCKENKKIKDH